MHTVGRFWKGGGNLIYSLSGVQSNLKVSPYHSNDSIYNCTYTMARTLDCSLTSFPESTDRAYS